jgi:hypothetical protein
MKKDKTQRDFISTEELLHLVADWRDRASEQVNDMLDPIEPSGPESSESLATRATWAAAADELAAATEGFGVVPEQVQLEPGCDRVLYFVSQRVFKPTRLCCQVYGYELFWKGQSYPTPCEVQIEHPCLDMGDVFAVMYERTATTEQQAVVFVKGKAVL